MLKKIFYFSIIQCFIFLFLSANENENIDIVKFEYGLGKVDVRMQFKLKILEEALKSTYDEYGEYVIKMDAPKMNNSRARKEMQRKGGSLNTFIALTNHDWENAAIPIRIPIRRGILSYRLLLIRKEDQEEFSKIKTIDDLKKKKVGLKLGWSLVKILEEFGFNIIKAPDYDGLFGMLNNGRYDYLPRGINEIFDEYNQKKDELKNIIIEPNILLIIPSPSYVFVSKHNPRLAERLKKGLELMVENGTLKSIFNEFYSEDIKKADLKKRRVLQLDNSFLPETVPLDKKEYWVDLLEY